MLRGLDFCLEQKKITKKALAKHMEVDPNTVYRWASGLLDPGISKVEKMADFLGCTPNDLVSNPPQPPTPDEQTQSPESGALSQEAEANSAA